MITNINKFKSHKTNEQQERMFDMINLGGRWSTPNGIGDEYSLSFDDVVEELLYYDDIRDNYTQVEVEEKINKMVKGDNIRFNGINNIMNFKVFRTQ